MAVSERGDPLEPVPGFGPLEPGPELTAPDDLVQALLGVAAEPVLLVAADYDGTLAELVDDPDSARPNAESLRLLTELATLEDTHVAVISGRPRTQLVAFTGLPECVHLVGSHGSEFDASWADQLPDGVGRLLSRIVEALDAVAAGIPGALVERKPTSAAFHYRMVDDALVGPAVSEALAAARRIEGATLKHGKQVLEVCALAADKGSALVRLAERVRADAVVFVGDDSTDEDAFSVLTDGDLGVKVGPGVTAAHVRIQGPTAVELLLAHLVELRTAVVRADATNGTDGPT